MSAAPPPLAALTAPERIHLQVSDDRDDLNEHFPVGSEVTWCADSVLAAEVCYIRSDLVPAASSNLPDAVADLIRVADELSLFTRRLLEHLNMQGEGHDTQAILGPIDAALTRCEAIARVALAGAPEFTLRVCRAPSGQWTWEVIDQGGPVTGGAGFPDQFEAVNDGICELMERMDRPTAESHATGSADPQPYERDERDYVHHTTGGAVG